MIKLDKIEKDTIEILIKNLRFEVSLDPKQDVIAYQVHKTDVKVLIKALEKSLQ